MRPGARLRDYHYVVDRDGRIFHDGTEIVDPLVLRFFLRAMTLTRDGRYLVLCQGEQNWFEPYDTPFVVLRLRPLVEADRLRALELVFAGEHREPLDPWTLESGNGHLYCRIRPDALRARFGRVAMQQLAPFLGDDGTGAALLLGDARYPIRDRTTVSC